MANCSPRNALNEICGDGKDDDCDGQVDEDCRASKESGPTPCCGCVVGSDPILLTNRAAVTTPFADFAVSVVSRLSLTRTWNSLDAAYFGGPVGQLGSGWHHEWEATLTCSGTSCTVARGASEGLRFERAETATSLDGLETWQLYRPAAGDVTEARRHLLAQRPGGAWIVFMADGSSLHFATACDACGAPDEFCTAPELGGKARLVKVTDAQGNGILLSRAVGTGILLGLADDLGHTLELRSATACADGLARELVYDGVRVATYEYEGVDLVRVTDADGAVLRAYWYDSGGLGLLRGIQDEAGLPIVEFAYDGNGDAIGIVDETTTATVDYSAAGVATVSESYGGGLASSGTRVFDASGNLASISEGCSCGGIRTFTYQGKDLQCATDAAGDYTFYGRDALGRVTRRARYPSTVGYTCPPQTDAHLQTYEDESFWFGVTREIAAGVSMSLDIQTAKLRTTGYLDEWVGEQRDYSPAPNEIDPAGYECAEAPLPAGAVMCRRVENGAIYSSTGARSLERHATFYSYDGRGRVTRVIGPVNLGQSSASDVAPVEERSYWPDSESLARRGRLAEIRRYPSPTAAPHATTFDYDMFGLYQSWQPDGSFTTWMKDGRGRVTHVLESDGRTSETRYHDGEKPRLRIGADGTVERKTYDARGRVTAQERLSGDPDLLGAKRDRAVGRVPPVRPRRKPGAQRAARRDRGGGLEAGPGVRRAAPAVEGEPSRGGERVAAVGVRAVGVPGPRDGRGRPVDELPAGVHRAGEDGDTGRGRLRWRAGVADGCDVRVRDVLARAQVGEGREGQHDDVPDRRLRSGAVGDDAEREGGEPDLEVRRPREHAAAQG